MKALSDIKALVSKLTGGRLYGARPPVVAVLPLTGAIGGAGPLRSGLTLSGLAAQIERAFKVKRVAAVALAINSPGGSPVQSALIARRIRALAEENNVPVIAFAEDVAASGGYWLACAADEIYADENSLIGSIGVVSAGFGFQDLLANHGIERRVHTAGDKKAMLDPFRPEDPKDVTRLKVIQKDMHESFKDLVRTRRGERLKGSERTLFSGEFWTARRALELGLVDGLGDLRGELRARYGERVRLRKITGRRPWWRRGMRSEIATWEPRDWAGGLIAAVEERLMWERFGL